MAPELAISERFLSIQGETTFAGLVCAFIRTAGCNLRCSYCDAAYTWQEPSTPTPVDDLLAWVDTQKTRLVAVTGGEPLVQPAVIPLLQGLVAGGYTVLLETNGSLDTTEVPEPVRVILDVKCPGSGMAGRLDTANLARLRPTDQVKFVLSHRQDYLWARQWLADHPLATSEILFSPVAGRLDPADLADWILADRLPVRLQLQLHKILWPGIHRGV